MFQLWTDSRTSNSCGVEYSVYIVLYNCRAYPTNVCVDKFGSARRVGLLRRRIVANRVLCKGIALIFFVNGLQRGRRNFSVF